MNATEIQEKRQHEEFVSEAVHAARGRIAFWNYAKGWGVIDCPEIDRQFFVTIDTFSRADRPLVVEYAEVEFSAKRQTVPEGDKRPKVHFARLAR